MRGGPWLECFPIGEQWPRIPTTPRALRFGTHTTHSALDGNEFMVGGDSDDTFYGKESYPGGSYDVGKGKNKVLRFRCVCGCRRGGWVRPVGGRAAARPIDPAPRPQSLTIHLPRPPAESVRSTGRRAR